MTVVLKTSKPSMFSSYWDTVSLIQDISTDLVDMSESSIDKVIKSASQIEAEIVKVDNLIRMMLRGFYDENQLVATTPWVTSAVPHPENKGDLQLISIAGGTSIDAAKTAAWTLKFTSTQDFTFTSSLEGAQSTGVITTDSAPTNLDVNVGSNAWVAGTETTESGDLYYFSVIDAQPEIYAISTKLAAAFILESVFTSEDPNSNAYAEKLRKDALSWLRRLQGPNNASGARLATYTARDLDSIHIDYHVNDFGIDDSSYSEAAPTRDGTGAEF